MKCDVWAVKQGGGVECDVWAVKQGGGVKCDGL